MKNIILIVFVMLTTGIFAQQTKYKYKKMEPVFKEVQGEKNTYIVRSLPHMFYIYNKNVQLRDSTSDYMLRDLSHRAYDYINLSDKELLDSYMKTYIAPWVKKNKQEFRFSEALGVHLYADMEGNILEVSIDCPKDIKLPVTAFEEFEQAVLSGELKLYTDTAYPIFKNSTWVGKTYLYKPETLRNMQQ